MFNKEQELLIDLAAGNEAAFSLLYRKYQDVVFYYARRFFTDDRDAEDITSSVFQKLWLQRRVFESFTHLQGFLLTVTRNLCINHIKLSQRRTARESQALATLETKETDFASHEFMAELMRQIDEALEKLPPQTAHIFRLAFLEEKNNHEISHLLNINEHTVRNQKSTALRLLRLSFRCCAILFHFL